MTVLAVAPEIDDRIGAEGLSPLNCESRNPRACIWIIAIHMEHRDAESLCDVGAVATAETVVLICRETNLVVHDEMNCATDGVAVESHHVQTFRNHALPSECSVAVHDERHDFLAIGVVVESLLAARSTEHDCRDERKMRWIRRKRESNFLP